MKKFKVIILLSLVLVGCKKPPTPSSSVDDKPTSITSAPISSEINSERTGQRKLDFYGINDFHGAIVESSSEPGIFKIGSYLKSRFAENPNGSIFLNSGDFWQGSADSNINKGKFLTEAMNELKLDAMTLGNHEFDWFDTAIKANKVIANYPFLGANVMLKESGQLATDLVHYDDTYGASTMLVKNDVRVGVIGTVGSRLESSISGLAIAPYSFEPVDAYIRAQAEILRNARADVITLVTHDSLANGAGEYTEIINDKIVDLIFTGHAHQEHNGTINGIPVLQTRGNGRQIMEVSAIYDFDTKMFLLQNSALQSADYIKSYYTDDQDLLDLFVPYAEEIDTIKNEVIGTLTDTIYASNLVNMANRVMYGYANSLKSYPNLVALHNGGGVRVSSIPSGQVTYGDIYKAFPFDNEIVIIENVSGSDMNSLVRGDYIPYSPGVSSFNYGEYYTLVTIDFISYRSGAVTLDYTQDHTLNYVRELIADHFREVGTINPSLY